MEQNTKMLIDEHHKRMEDLKAKVGPGPWTEEPNRKEWVHAGLQCMIVRGPLGALCGYVAVTEGHPLYGKGYDEAHDIAREKEAPLRVHGGLTYSAACQGPICHVPAPGEPDKVWWFGFDCAHYGDQVPTHLLFGEAYRSLRTHDNYRDLAYVEAETSRLAEQLSALPGDAG